MKKNTQLMVMLEFLTIIFFIAIAIKILLRIDLLSNDPVDHSLMVLENLRSNLSPEPFERILYLSFLILLPIYFGIRSLIKKSPINNDNSNGWILVTLLIFILFDVRYLKVILGYGDFYKYFEPKINFIIPLIYASIMVMYVKYDSEDKKRYILTLVNLMLILPVLYLWRVIDGDKVLSTGPIWGHLDLILYSISESVWGKSPLYELESQYGFYVEIFSLASKIININLFSVTLTFLFIQFIGVAATIVALQKIVINRYIFILGSLGIIGISSTFHSLFNGGDDMYLQYYPIRFIFPSLFLLLFINYLEKNNRKNLVLLCVVGSFAIFWNLDSGMAIIYAWLSYNFIMFFASIKKAEYVRNIVATILILVLISALFIAYIYLKSNTGKIPDIELLSKYQTIFWKMGYFMMPIPWPNSVALYSLFLVVFAMVFGVNKDQEGVDDFHKSILIFIPLLFSGVFIYYQGRSHVLNFALISWLFFMLVLTLFDFLILKKKFYMVRTLLPAVLFIALSGVGYLAKYQSVIGYLNGKRNIEYNDNRYIYLREKIQFIRGQASNHESCLILTPHQGLFHLEAGVRSSFNGPSLVELILSTDLLKYKNAAHEASCLIFGVDKFDPNLPFKWSDVSINYSTIKFNADRTLVYMSKQ